MTEKADTFLFRDPRRRTDLALGIGHLVEMLRDHRLRAREDEFHRIDAERDHLVAEFLDLGDALAIALAGAINGALERRRFDARPRQETARDFVAQPDLDLRPRRPTGESGGIAVIE